MTRYSFRTDQPYSGRLIGIHQRPIENDPQLEIRLLRMEFEVYWRVSHPKRILQSRGEIACRDLIIGDRIPPSKDAGQQVYANAIGVKGDLTKLAAWLHVAKSTVWVEIVFGSPENVGGRNPFATIKPFAPSGWEIEEYRYDRSQEWVSVAAAADAVCVSTSTIRRRVDSLEAEFGERLIRRTDGNQRRIHLPLFVNVWSE